MSFSKVTAGAVHSLARAHSRRRALRVQVALTETDESRMRPGMAARVEVLAGGRPNVLLAPGGALALDGVHPQAILDDGRRVAVELGPCNAFECVVEGGLEAGRRLGLRAGWP